MRSLLLLALVGCGVSSNAPTTFDPTATPTGVYRLTAEVQDDSCTPSRGVGNGDVPLFANASGALVVRVIEGHEAVASQDAYTLTSDSGYSLQIPFEGKHINPCFPAEASPGSSVTTDLTLVAADAHRAEVDLDRTYVIAPGCNNAPQATCHASYALHYELVDACPERCLSETISGTTCTCH